MRSPASIRAVIFDFDGLLADTEALHFETFAAVLADEGVYVTREENDSRFLGISDSGCFEIAFREAGRTLCRELCDELVQRKSERYLRKVERVPLFAGARKLIEESAARGPTTIASCGRRQDITSILRRHGLLTFFPRFVSAEDIERSKPDPECFLKALELLRSTPDLTLRPQECAVFEDSFRGVEAAKRAGMLCVGVTHSYAASQLAAADWVISSLEEWHWPRG